MLAFEFDRAKMRRKFGLYTAASAGGIALTAAVIVWGNSHFGSHNWASIAILLLASVVFGNFIDYLRWAGILGRSLMRQGTAVVINREGLVDNATDYALGQITWSEIEKMYPWSWKNHLVSDWLQKMPVICEQRGLMIVLKDGADFQDRLRHKSWIRREAFKSLFVRGQKRWLFVPEMLLDTSAGDLMKRLNGFYSAEVRR